MHYIDNDRMIEMMEEQEVKTKKTNSTGFTTPNLSFSANQDQIEDYFLNENLVRGNFANYEFNPNIQ